MRIYRRQGLPFEISRAKKRKVLALGSIIFLLGLYVLSSFVWFVEVKGNEDLTQQEIKEFARQYGLEPGASKGGLQIDKLEGQIKEAHPKIAWVGITITGTKVTIEIAEKVLIPETEDHQKADLVAKADGVIEEMLVLVGTPQVKEGDRVQKGQVLISGVVYPEIIVQQDGTLLPGGEPELVRARGVVRGRVKHSIIATCGLIEDKINYTGRRARQVLIAFNNQQIIIDGPKEEPFLDYQVVTNSKKILSWRNFNIPVEVITKDYQEIERETINYGYEGAYQEAISRSEEMLQKILPKDASVKGKEVRLNPTGVKIEGVVEVEVIWECSENIGIHASIAF